MRKVLLLAFFGGILLSSCDNTSKLIEHEWKVYNAAVEVGDLTTAIGSLNSIVAEEKYNADALDTLAILYLNSGADAAAVKIAKRALNVRESDEIVRVLAKGNKNLKKFEDALPYYSKLLEKQPESLELLYELAFVNINLNKGNEAVPYIQKIIAHPNSSSAVMSEYYQNASQLVPYRAVAFNLLGFLQTKAQQKEQAVKSYQTALSIFPNYVLAKNNLSLLNQQTN